jgi:hypothetical protein
MAGDEYRALVRYSFSAKGAAAHDAVAQYAQAKPTALSTVECKHPNTVKVLYLA